MKLGRFGNILFISFLCFVGVLRGEEFSGKVVGVMDGDTIKVMHDGKAEKIRLYGVDAPEKAQAFGQKAKKFTSEMVFGKEVKVVVVDTDRYGRTVGKVFLEDGRMLNHELVKNGFAWWYQRYAKNDVDLQRFEKEAKDSKKGLWTEETPTPPWEWRRKK